MIGSTITGWLLFLGLLILVLLVVTTVFRKKWLFFPIVLMFVVATLFAGAYIGYYAGLGQVDETQGYWYQNVSLQSTPYSSVETEDQRRILGRLGNPDGFLLLYLGENGMNRYERWYYCVEETEFAFMEGLLVEEIHNPGLADMKSPLDIVYNPTEFVFDMDQQTALDLTESNQFLFLPVEEELIENGEIYYGNSITLGFSEGRLYYAETLLYDEKEVSYVQ